MKNLNELLNESIVDEQKKDAIKKIGLALINEKDPDAFIDFVSDIIHTIKERADVKAEMTSKNDPTIEAWEALGAELAKATEDYIIMIEDVQKSL